MSDTRTILMLDGDGIGPEVMRETRRVIGWFSRHGGTGYELSDGLVGGASYDAHGEPLTDETLKLAADADAVLLGAVGGPQWEDLAFDKKPERGLLGLRKELGLFANLRPAVVFEALAGASTLKTDVVAGLDMMIVRELTGGIYFGEPRGVEELPDGTRKGVNSLTYTSGEVERIARVAFELAMNVAGSCVRWTRPTCWNRPGCGARSPRRSRASIRTSSWNTFWSMRQPCSSSEIRLTTT